MEDRFCMNCNMKLIQRDNECNSRFIKRRFCSNNCGSQYFWKSEEKIETKERLKDMLRQNGRRFKKIRIPITCNQCSKKFLPKSVTNLSKNPKYCSRSCSKLAFWNNPEYRERTSNSIRTSLKVSEKNKEILDRISQMTPQKRINISKSKIGKGMGEDNPFFNHKHTEENKKIIGEKSSIANKKLWENPEHARKIFEALKFRPSSYEKKISDLCIEYNLPFIYTGNGTFLIGHKNPDFKHKELRMAIEVYNRHHHPENYEEIRGEYFKKYGYKTIFINQEEVTSKDWKNICLNKIKSNL